MVVDQVLRGSRFVIDIACIDLGPVIEQVSRDFYIAGTVQWRLAIAASGIGPASRSPRSTAQTIDHLETGRGMHVHDGTGSIA